MWLAKISTSCKRKEMYQLSTHWRTWKSTARPYFHSRTSFSLYAHWNEKEETNFRVGEIERERGRERKLINVSIEKKKIVICVARASMVLFSLGEINKNIPGNFERSLTSNTLYQHLCKAQSPQVTQAWIRIPFNPTFRIFHWSNETECTFNWSDRNIGDQLWRWSTLTGLVGPNWQNCCPQYRSFVSSLLTWLKKVSYTVTWFSAQWWRHKACFFKSGT